MRDDVKRRVRFARTPLAHVICGLSLLAVLPACRVSAPDDLVQEEETTEALVFVKTAGEETLNRSSASGNLYKLSPISPDGTVTPITNYVGAQISDPVVSFTADLRICSNLTEGHVTMRALVETRNSGLGEVGLPSSGPRVVHGHGNRARGHEGSTTRSDG